MVTGTLYLVCCDPNTPIGRGVVIWTASSYGDYCSKMAIVIVKQLPMNCCNV